MDATFSNCGFFYNNNEQSYPDVLPFPHGAEPHAAWTGAAERQTLGEPRSFAGMDPNYVRDCSGVYHLDWTYPHAAPTLDLNFFTTHDHDHGLPWGLLAVRVRAVPHAPRLTADQLRADWAALGGADPVAADAALWRLAATGDQAVAFVRDALAHRPAQGPVVSPYRPGRVDHLMEVIGTPAADEVRPTGGF